MINQKKIKKDLFIKEKKIEGKDFQENSFLFFPFENKKKIIDLEDKTKALVLLTMNQEIEKLIYENIIELDDLDKDKEVFEKVQTDNYLKAEIKSLKKNQKLILDKIDKLKDKILKLHKLKFEDLEIINNLDLDYTLEKLNQETIDDQKFLKLLDEHLNLLNNLIEEQLRIGEITELVEEKSEEIGQEELFQKKLEKELKEQEKVLDSLEQEEKNIDNLLSEIERKINHTTLTIKKEIVEKEKLIVDVNVVIETVLYFTLAKTIKSDFLKVALKAKGIIHLTKILSKEKVYDEKTKIIESFNKANSEFTKADDILKNSHGILNKALDSIKDFKNEYDKNFFHLDQNQSLFKNILKLESNLLSEKTKITEYQDKLKKKKDRVLVKEKES